MRVIAVAAILAAALAGASAQAANCTALALNVSSCVQAAFAGYSNNGGNNNYNPVTQCCGQQTALTNACGSLLTQLGANFYLADVGAQQLVLDAAASCPTNTGTTCVASTSALMQCTLPAALGVTQYTFPFFNITSGTFTISVTLIDGSTVTTSPIGRDATVATVTTAINAASPQAPFIVTGVTKATTADVGTYNLTITANANPTSSMPAVIIYSGGLMGAPPNGIPPIVMAVQQPVPLTSLTSSSPCCSQTIAINQNCQGYQFENASAPNYAFAFPVNFNGVYASTFTKSYVDVCPSFPPGFCAPALTATSQCLASQGYYNNPGNFNGGPCCTYSSFANETCTGYNATAASAIASLNLNSSAAKVLQQELVVCNNQNNNGNGNNNNGSGNNNNGNGGNSCSGALPNIFAYTYPNGTVVPITNTCNPTNPSDPNYHYGCTVVTTVNGRPYFKYHPLASQSAASTYYYNSGCGGQ